MSPGFFGHIFVLKQRLWEGFRMVKFSVEKCFHQKLAWHVQTKLETFRTPTIAPFINICWGGNNCLLLFLSVKRTDIQEILRSWKGKAWGQLEWKSIWTVVYRAPLESLDYAAARWRCKMYSAGNCTKSTIDDFIAKNSARKPEHFVFLCE